MCELRSLIYRLVILKSVKVASSLKQEWHYRTVRNYGTVRLNFCKEVRYASTYGTDQCARYVVRKF